MRIARVGADGDGIGTLPDGSSLFIPFTLPGELVEPGPLTPRGRGWSASPAIILELSAERVAPPCPHFGRCGGCALQHWSDAAYAAWKRDLLVEALAGSGAEIPPLVRTPPASRRRIDLAVRRTGGAVVLGLHAGRSGEVVDMASCTILHPRLLALLAPLRAALRGLGGLRRAGSAVLTLLDTGPDLLLRLDGALSTADRTALAGFASRHGIPRIAWAIGDGPPETACQLGPATIALSGVSVAVPPGGFLQASAAGEAAIVAAVLAALPPRLPARARIVELFAGSGSLSFALARHGRVQAFEGDAEAVAALRRAAGGTRVEAVQRDLARRPLLPQELAGAACVVLDPPYAGAAAQVAELGRAAVPLVIYVSCNPAALTRDARTLASGGYQAISATPIDQFLWSSRLESVVTFTRDPKG